MAGSKIYVDWRGGGTLIAPLFSTQKWYFLVSNLMFQKIPYGILVPHPFLCKKRVELVPKWVFTGGGVDITTRTVVDSSGAVQE